MIPSSWNLKVLVLNFSISISILAALPSSSEAQNWTAVSTGVPGTSASVDAMIVYKGVLLAAGNYQSIQQWDGSAWSAFGTTPPTATAFYADGDSLFAGGQFTGGTAYKEIHKYDGSAWTIVGGAVGAYDSISWNTNYMYSVFFKLNNVFYAKCDAGLFWFDPALQKFRRAGGASTFATTGIFAGFLNGKAVFYRTSDASVGFLNLNGSQWDSLSLKTVFPAITPVNGFNPTATLTGAAVFNNELYLSGTFPKDSTTFNSLIKYNGTTYTNLFSFPAHLYPFPNPLFSQLLPLGSTLFSRYSDNIGNDYIGVISGSTVTALGASIGSSTLSLSCLAIYNNQLYAGGYFSTFAGVSAANIARIAYSGTALRSDGFHPPMSSPFSTGIRFDGKGVDVEKGGLFDLRGARISPPLKAPIQ